MHKPFIQVCHSCGREVITVNTHYRARLVDATVYFHPLCLPYFVKQRGNVLRDVVKREAKENI